MISALTPGPRGIQFGKQIPDPKQDNCCMNHILSDQNGFSRRTSECNGCRNHFCCQIDDFLPK